MKIPHPIMAVTILVTAALGGANTAHAQSTNNSPGLISPYSGAKMDEATLHEQYDQLQRKLIEDWFESNGQISDASLQSYHLLVSLATRQGIRLEPRLRTDQEACLPAALLIARLEALHLTHPYTYGLRLKKPVATL